jgi:hypothetical protein
MGGMPPEGGMGGPHMQQQGGYMGRGGMGGGRGRSHYDPNMGGYPQAGGNYPQGKGGPHMHGRGGMMGGMQHMAPQMGATYVHSAGVSGKGVYPGPPGKKSSGQSTPSPLTPSPVPPPMMKPGGEPAPESYESSGSIVMGFSEGEGPGYEGPAPLPSSSSIPGAVGGPQKGVAAYPSANGAGEVSGAMTTSSSSVTSPGGAVGKGGGGGGAGYQSFSSSSPKGMAHSNSSSTGSVTGVVPSSAGGGGGASGSTAGNGVGNAAIEGKVKGRGGAAYSATAHATAAAAATAGGGDYIPGGYW